MDARCKRGFTLVEMLVVVVIIGILAGLISAAAIRARRSAMNATVVTDIAQLELALGQYKERFGEYPPDCAETEQTVPTRTAVVRMHLAKAFPRADSSNYTPPALDSSTALVFFLGGVPTLARDSQGNVTGVVALTGFSPNPTNPFDTNPTQGRIGPFLDFDCSRLQVVVSGGNDPTRYTFRYLPPNEPSSTLPASRQSDPYVYFKARPYNPLAAYKLRDDISESTAQDLSAKIDSQQRQLEIYCTVGNAMVKPYHLWQDASTVVGWVNPTKFQILSPGLDGKYISVLDTTQPCRAYPVGFPKPSSSTQPRCSTDAGVYPTYYNKAQFDDITNFSGGTLESKIP